MSPKSSFQEVSISIGPTPHFKYNLIGFYVVSYILGLFVLHITVQFFTPLGLPDLDEEFMEGNKVYGDLPSV